MLRQCFKLLAGLLFGFVPVLGYAATESSEAVVWTLMSSVLGLLAVVGLMLVESGQMRAKNSLSALMRGILSLLVSAALFVCVGYSVMYGQSVGGLIGLEPLMVTQLSGLVAVQLLLQLVFVFLCAVVVNIASAERMKLAPALVVSAILSAVLIPVFGHWAWNAQGWLFQMGFIDFAGSSVLFAVTGWSALAVCILVGPRLGRFDPQTGEVRAMPGHNQVWTLLGVLLAMVGWLALLLGHAHYQHQELDTLVLNGLLGGGAAMLGALVVSAMKRTPLYAHTLAQGMLSGLVAISAGAVSMEPWSAVVTGLECARLVVSDGVY